MTDLIDRICNKICCDGEPCLLPSDCHISLWRDNARAILSDVLNEVCKPASEEMALHWSSQEAWRAMSAIRRREIEGESK